MKEPEAEWKNKGKKLFLKKKPDSFHTQVAIRVIVIIVERQKNWSGQRRCGGSESVAMQSEGCQRSQDGNTAASRGRDEGDKIETHLTVWKEASNKEAREGL